MITEEMKKEYLEAGGMLCPYCGSHSVRADHIDCDSDEAWSKVRCEDCGKKWKDLYKLTDILEEAE